MYFLIPMIKFKLSSEKSKFSKISNTMYFTASQYLKSFLKILVVTLKNEIFLTLYSVKFERSALLSESILSQ